VLIKTFGLFWRRDEVDWEPGTGHTFRLLGRNRDRNPNLWLADFQHQTGIYILYGNHGAYYVGLTKSEATGLAGRLKDHNARKEKWDRFSWFGFRTVKKGRDDRSFHELGKMPNVKNNANVTEIITDVEALLIRAMGLAENANATGFTNAVEWYQVKISEEDYFLSKCQ
jgi:predicted MPP superfamily phosphohydrolase